MARATFIVELDLDGDGAYEEDITSDVISATTFHGRENDIDAADIGQATLVLKNVTGKYSPKSGILANYKNYKKIRIRTTAPSAVPHFTGFITSIAPDPSHKKQRTTIKASDSMELLKQIYISQRLMQDQLTGIIFNRLLDASEGELVANTSFDEDLTGYNAATGATLTRKTSGDILEGAACMETITIASTSSGWEHDLLSVTSDGDKVTFRVYLIAGTPDDVGRVVKLWGNAGGGSGSSRLKIIPVS